jgi:hypothetical protein
MNLALSFNDFIFESFGGDRLDFCLAVLHEYMKVGRGMDHLPEDIQRCIKSNGQTDFSPLLGSIYDEYLKNGNSFEGMPNPVKEIDNIDLANKIGKRLDPSSEIPFFKNISDKMQAVIDIILKYGNSIEISIDPYEGESEYEGLTEVLISGEMSILLEIEDMLVPILGEEKVVSASYSEIILLLNDQELELLEDNLGDSPNIYRGGMKAEDKMHMVHNIILKYGKSIQFSIVPDEDYADNNTLVIAGRRVTIDEVFEHLSYLFNEDKLIFSSKKEEYSEIIVFLNNKELKLLENYLG